MTASLIDRLTAPAVPEEPPVTSPRPRVPGVPWWAGVRGLDPAVPVTDWEVAARYAAFACAIYVYGPDAVYRAGAWPFGKAAVTPNMRMRAWLLDGSVTTPEHAERRRFALRQACEHAADVKVDALLEFAQDFADALAPG